MPDSRDRIAVPRSLAPLSLAALALTTVLGTASGAEAARDDVRHIRACFSEKTGKIRIVPRLTDCRPREDSIVWVRGGE